MIDDLYHAFVVLALPYSLSDKLWREIKSEFVVKHYAILDVVETFTPGQWEVFSRKVGADKAKVKIANCPDLIPHVKFTFMLKGKPVHFYYYGDTIQKLPKRNFSLDYSQVDAVIAEIANTSSLNQQVRDEQSTSRRQEANAGNEVSELMAFWSSKSEAASATLRKAEDCKNKIQKCKSDIEKGNSEIGSLMAAADESVKALSHKQEEWSALSRKTTSPTYAITDADTKLIQSLRQKNEASIADLRKQASKIKSIETGIDQLKLEISKQQSEIAASKQEVEKICSEVNQTLSKIHQLISTIQSDKAVKDEWRRIEAKVKDQPAKEQLKAVKLWHLTEAGNHSEKHKVIEQLNNLNAIMQTAPKSWKERLAAVARH